MEKMNVLDGNKLIVEFICKNGPKDSDGTPIFESPNVRIRWTEEVKHNSFNSMLGFKYHKSWDWLIPVVEKIEILMTNWNIPNYKNGYSEWMDKFRFAFYDIKCLYEYVVEFIKWYNENE